MKALVLLGLFVAACTTGPIVETPPLRDTPVVSGTDEDCAAACAHLCELNCEECHPTAGSCNEVCLNTEHSGYATMNPACLRKVTACSETDGC